jgi:dTDP-4-dehydrorhamnose 3,5-epimerase-like enzyme
LKIVTTPLEGFLIIETDVYRDERGFFLETYQRDRYINSGIEDNFVQENQSRSSKGILRGMHFQVKRPQIIHGGIGQQYYSIRYEAFKMVAEVTEKISGRQVAIQLNGPPTQTR